MLTGIAMFLAGLVVDVGRVAAPAAFPAWTSDVPWSAVALAAAFLLAVLWADRCRTVELRAEVDRLRADAVPRLLIRHVADCRQCVGPSPEGNPTFGIEVSNAGARSIRDVVVDVASVDPSPLVMLQYPITVGRFAALNPGEPPAHVRLLVWELPDTFLIPRAGDRNVAFPTAEFTIDVVAHADAPPARATFVTERDGQMWWIRQVEGTA